MTYNEKTGNVEGIGVMRLGFETNIVRNKVIRQGGQNV